MNEEDVRQTFYELEIRLRESKDAILKEFGLTYPAYKRMKEDVASEIAQGDPSTWTADYNGYRFIVTSRHITASSGNKSMDLGDKYYVRVERLPKGK